MALSSMSDLSKRREMPLGCQFLTIMAIRLGLQ